MSDDERPGAAPKKGLQKAADFREEIERRGQADIRQELGLPNIDEILKDLQQRYGVRVGLSPAMIEKLEAAKGRQDDVVLRSGCYSIDVCILCDHGDLCSTCDVADWCVSSDTHFA